MGFAMRCSNRSRPSGGFLCRPNFGISAPLIESEPNGGRGVMMRSALGNGSAVERARRAGTRRLGGDSQGRAGAGLGSRSGTEKGRRVV
jgi:hypothetical protein